LSRNFPFRERQQPKPQIYRFGFLVVFILGTLTIETNGGRQGKNCVVSKIGFGMHLPEVPLGMKFGHAGIELYLD
jgi:hypothetical protein